jgi:putative (di)nucleoside polyphosphate hydrolase
MLVNSDRKIFVGQRIDNDVEAWQMPQGGIDDGESPRVAALRELAEETGTDKAEIVAESSDWYYYDLPEELQNKIWGGRFIGQKQKWFLMRFMGNDSDINLATAHPEFSAWRWAEPHELPLLIVPFKRRLYEEILAEFMPILGEE